MSSPSRASVRPTALAALATLAVAVLAACGSGASPSTVPASSPSGSSAPDARQLIVDTDLGADDLMALAYLSAHEDVELRAVTVSGTGLARCPVGARNAAAVLARLGRADVPVGCGSAETVGPGHAFPDAWRNGSDTAYGLTLPDPSVPVDTPALDVLTAAIEGSPAPVDLLVLGPATNVARALAARPDLPARIASITFMGGAIASPGNVSGSGVADENGVAEWNVFADPVAWQAVLAANRPTTIVPLDATDDLPLSRGFYLELAANRDTEASKLAWEVLDRSPFLVEGGQSFWDQLAAVTLIDRGPVTFEPRTVRVETTDSRSLGRTVVDAAATRADVAVAADEQAFRAAFISGLNGGRAVASPPASPPTIRFAFDGTTCTPTLPPDLAAGFVAIELENRSKVAAGAGIILLPDGMTAADVERLAREDPNALGTIQGSQTGTGASPGATSRDVGVIGAGRHAVACISYEPTLAIIGIRDVEVAP